MYILYIRSSKKGLVSCITAGPEGLDEQLNQLRDKEFRYLGDKCTDTISDIGNRKENPCGPY